jgi:hypothetical protein
VILIIGGAFAFPGAWLEVSFFIRGMVSVCWAWFFLSLLHPKQREQQIKNTYRGFAIIFI